MNSECDEWTGRLDRWGYGSLYICRFGRRNVYLAPHRLVWMQEYGHTDLQINHLCDNSACINLEHLYAGTHQQNMQDMAERGRARNQWTGPSKSRNAVSVVP